MNNQTILITIVLVGTLAFMLYRMVISIRNLVLNKAPSCHGDKDPDCPGCHSNIHNE